MENILDLYNTGKNTDIKDLNKLEEIANELFLKSKTLDNSNNIKNKNSNNNETEKNMKNNQMKQTMYYESIRWCVGVLSHKYIREKNINNYFNLIKSIYDVKNTNTTFLVKLIIKLITEIENNKDFNKKEIINLIKDLINTCDQTSNISMKNKLNIKLSELYYFIEEYKNGLEVINKTLVDLKKYEDNLGLIEIQLIESKIHYKSKGIIKAKAALTTVKTLSTKVYIEPNLQAKIDMHSGVLAAHEKDFDLSYSYFYESFDVYNLPQVKKPDEALKALLYMIISKIMSNKLDEVNTVIYGKNQQKFLIDKNNSIQIMALKEIEKCVREKNIKKLGEIVNQNKEVLLSDYFINHHLIILHDELLEKNLKKIILPYSVVEIKYITEEVGINNHEILNKLSQMILDKKINGIIDQGRGSLIIYENSDNNEYLEKSLTCYKNLDKVVNSLSNKAKSYNIN